jgi:hypothetical protein
MVTVTDMGTDTPKGAMIIRHNNNKNSRSSSSKTEDMIATMCSRTIMFPEKQQSPHAIASVAGLRVQRRLSVGCGRRRAQAQRGARVPDRVAAKAVHAWATTGMAPRPSSFTLLAVSQRFITLRALFCY